MHYFIFVCLKLSSCTCEAFLEICDIAKEGMIYVAECCCSKRKVWRKVCLMMSIGLDAGLWIGGMLGKELFGQLLFILLVSILSSLVLINYS